GAGPGGPGTGQAGRPLQGERPGEPGPQADDPRRRPGGPGCDGPGAAPGPASAGRLGPAEDRRRDGPCRGPASRPRGRGLGRVLASNDTPETKSARPPGRSFSLPPAGAAASALRKPARRRLMPENTQGGTRKAQLTMDDLMFRPGLMQGQRILITGGGTGLGKAMAEACLMLGAEVYICGRRGGVLDDTAKELMDAHGGRMVGIPCDIRVPEAIDEMLDRIWADGGALTGLVNNAAGNFISRTEDLSPRGFDAIANI